MSADHELGEGKLMALLSNLVALHLLLHLVEQLLGDDRLMLALVPVTATFSDIRRAVVEGILSVLNILPERQ